MTLRLSCRWTGLDLQGGVDNARVTNASPLLHRHDRRTRARAHTSWGAWDWSCSTPHNLIHEHRRHLAGANGSLWTARLAGRLLKRKNVGGVFRLEVGRFRKGRLGVLVCGGRIDAGLQLAEPPSEAVKPKCLGLRWRKLLRVQGDTRFDPSPMR